MMFLNSKLLTQPSNPAPLHQCGLHDGEIPLTTFPCQAPDGGRLCSPGKAEEGGER